MKFMPALLLLALVCCGHGDKEVFDRVLALNIAKLNDTESLEVTILRKDNDWMRLQERLSEIHMRRYDFWSSRAAAGDAEASSQAFDFLKASVIIKNWKPSMDSSALILNESNATIAAMKAEKERYKNQNESNKGRKK